MNPYAFRRILVAALPILALLTAAPAAAEEQFRVIVHPSNPVASLTHRQVSALFLKMVTRWPDGSVVKPAQPVPESKIRRAFSQAVHGKTVAAVKAYWSQLIFTGREVPPIEKAKDDEIVAFVAVNETAIGVIAVSSPAQGVKEVQLR